MSFSSKRLEVPRWRHVGRKEKVKQNVYDWWNQRGLRDKGTESLRRFETDPRGDDVKIINRND